MIIKEVKIETIILEEQDIKVLENARKLLCNLAEADYFFEEEMIDAKTLVNMAYTLTCMINKPEINF